MIEIGEVVESLCFIKRSIVCIKRRSRAEAGSPASSEVCFRMCRWPMCEVAVAFALSSGYCKLDLFGVCISQGASSRHSEMAGVRKSPRVATLWCQNLCFLILGVLKHPETYFSSHIT